MNESLWQISRIWARAILIRRRERASERVSVLSSGFVKITNLNNKENSQKWWNYKVQISRKWCSNLCSLWWCFLYVWAPKRSVLSFPLMRMKWKQQQHLVSLKSVMFNYCHFVVIQWTYYCCLLKKKEEEEWRVVKISRIVCWLPSPFTTKRLCSFYCYFICGFFVHLI